MNPSCHINDPSRYIQILLKQHRSGLKVLGTLSKVEDGRDRFTKQSCSSQTDPKDQDAFKFSHLFWCVLLFSTPNLADFKVITSVWTDPEYGTITSALLPTKTQSLSFPF